jgi:endoglucanase
MERDHFLRRLPVSCVILALSMVVVCQSPRVLAGGFLHISGENMVDADGNQVLLRGVGLGNWLLPEGYMWRFGSLGDRPRRIEKIVSDLIGPEHAKTFWNEYRRQYITEQDIQRIAELGFNSVRVPLNARLLMSEADASFQDEGFELLDNLVQWCKASGIYVIIDMHAAPGGQTGQNIDDSAADQPELFTNPENQQRLIKLWVAIAERYKNEPMVAAFDLLNEPLPAKTGAEGQYKKILEPLYERIVKEIRKVDPQHMITVEGADWANDWSVFSRQLDNNTFYQFHYYCWDNPTELKSIQHYLNERSRLQAPTWAGETGERDNTVYWATTQYFEANNVGWSFWPWKKMAASNAPYSIVPPENWRAVAAVSRSDAAEKPTRDTAQKILDELLKNIQLKNCKYHEDVVSALFHRVPGRVEVENYGTQGENRSYFVNATSKRSPLYRKSEPVQIEANDLTTGRGAGQAIRLGAGEWTVYDVNVLEDKTFDLTIRARADLAPTTLKVVANNQTDRGLSITAADKSWQEIPVGRVKLTKGANRVKLMVESGVAAIDWLDFQ